MAIFKSDPMKTLQRDLDAARLNRDRLAAKLSESETSAAARRGEAQQLAYDNEEGSALARAQTALQAALGDVVIFGGALAKATAVLATLETQHAELIDQKTRKQTAAEIGTMAIDLEKAAATFDAAIAGLADVSGRAAAFIYDAVGLEAFAASSRQQVPPAVELISVLLRNHAAAVLAGSASATLLKAEPVAAQAPPPAVTRVWTIKPIAFQQDGFGLIRIVDLNQQIDLSPELAAKAISAGAAVALGAPEFGKQRANFRASQGRGLPSLENCIRLDAEADEALGEEKSRPTTLDPVLRSLPGGPGGFEQIDRGGPFLVKTHTGNPTSGE
jgi:hypothetical protein